MLIETKAKFQKFISAIFLLAFSFSFPLFAEPAVTTRYEYYDVDGKSRDELRQAMQQQSRRFTGGEHDAFTNWHIDWNYKSGFADGSCHVTSFEVKENIVFHMPRWKKPSNALKRDWDKFVKALQKHEDGHAKTGKECVLEVEKKIQNFGSSPNCGQLGGELSRIVNMTISEYQQREVDYDNKTKHGMTQGAAW